MTPDGFYPGFPQADSDLDGHCVECQLFGSTSHVRIRPRAVSDQSGKQSINEEDLGAARLFCAASVWTAVICI